MSEGEKNRRVILPQSRRAAASRGEEDGVTNSLHASRRAWRNQAQETIVSSFQADVSAMLNVMGITHTVEYPTEVRARGRC